MPLQLPPAGIYLDDVSRLFSVFFENGHGWGVTVNVEFFLQVGSFRKALVHIAELQVVSVSKSCQLRRRVNTQLGVSEALHCHWPLM